MPEHRAELDAAAKAAIQADINDVKIGHSLASDVGIYVSYTTGGHSVALVDTPGFGDTCRSDTDVLTDMAYFLAQVYSNNFRLAGIMYIHRVLDSRMTGSSTYSRRSVARRRICPTDGGKGSATQQDPRAAEKSHGEAMQNDNEKMAAILAKQERKHKEKLDRLDRDKEKRMQALEQDYEKLQPRHRGPRKEGDGAGGKGEAIKVSGASPQGHRDADREAKAQQQREVNRLQIVTLLARIPQRKRDAPDLAARKNMPAVASVIQALAGVGALAAGFKSGSTTLMASGTGLLTNAASTF
ncbi:hypothetical protein ACHAPT_006077 [Fusarium lateritium]